MTPLGIALKKARIAAGIDVRNASSLLGVSQSAVYNIECGSWHPSRKRLDSMAAAYGVTGDALDAIRTLRAPNGDVTFGWSETQRRNHEIAALRAVDTTRSALTAARVAAGLTGAKLSAATYGCTQSLLASLETGRYSPLRRSDGRWRNIALNVAAALGTTPEELWPDVAPSIPSDYTDDREVPTPEQIVATCEHNAFARSIVATLTARERDVLNRRFGFVGEEQTLEECGDAYGLTKERVRQIESGALRTLRTRLSARGVAV